MANVAQHMPAGKESAFGILKRTYGLSRAKLVGLEKVASEVWAKAIAYNLKRALSRLMPA